MGKKRIFADGMENISFTDGLIRMQLFNSEMIKGENGKNVVIHESDQELIMSPQGFINAFSAMEKLISQLMEAGLIKKTNPNPQGNGDAQQPARAQESSSTISVSPNFQ